MLFQDNIVAEFSTTIITIPLTTNLRRAFFNLFINSK
ncbi:hypothetical protein [Nostoc sp. DedSLP04]|nr:hypothetical protein [Nostoc sp. DedSLP04]MDZ8033502.1 hypothetical protein [Nostoc sp. DedSLP04]